MKKKYLLLSLICLTSCNVDPSTLKIVYPTGAPALAFYNNVENANFETNSTPSNIVSMMNGNSNYDIVVIDTVSGIKAINNGANFKLAATVTFGNFYLAATGNDENSTLDKDDVVILFGQNQTPDLLFNKIKGEGYNVEYVTNVQDAAKCLASGKNMITKSTVDYVFIAQPALYTILNNKDALTYGNASVYANIQEEYKKITNYDLVQASLFVNANSDSKMVDSFLKDLEKDIKNLLENPSLLSDKIDYTSQELSTKYGVNFKACEQLLNDDNAIGLGYKKAIDNKDNIDNFISLFNLGTTNEEIYYK